jgi:hypothetical protein
VTGARCPLTTPAVTVVEQQATIEPHCNQGVQPGGICVYVHVVQREPTPGGPGSGLRRGSRRFPCQLPLWFYSIYMLRVWSNLAPGSLGAVAGDPDRHRGRHLCQPPCRGLPAGGWGIARHRLAGLGRSSKCVPRMDKA